MFDIDCLIRKWRLEDRAALAKNLNNRRVLDNLRDGLPYPYTERDAEDYIRAMLSADADKTFAFAITVDGEVIGSIGVFRRDNIHCRTAELGYYIGEPYWGRGYTTGAVRQICAWVFGHTDIIRIFAEPFARNVASCRVLEKAGFQLEGTLRSNAVKNGKIEDMKLYALVKDGRSCQGAEGEAERKKTAGTEKKTGQRYIVFDVETPNRLNNRMSAIGITVIEDGQITEEFFSYVDPQQPFDWFNTQLTGISEETVADAPSFPELWPEIEPLMSSGVLVAHNASFDMGVLRKCLADYGIDWLPRVRGLCTVSMGRRLIPGVSHKLNDLCDYYGIGLTYHHADSDSRACAEILLRYLETGADPGKFVRTYTMTP